MHTLTASSTTTAQPRAARRYGLILFFVAAYAWTWLFQLLSMLIARHTISLPLPRELVETIGFLGPALAALVVTAYEAGGAGVRALLAQLQARYGALTASLILGVFWACWHLPAWFLPDSPQAGLSFPVFLVSVVATSIIYTWFYNSTGGSLLLIIVLHTIFDICTTGPWAGALMAAHSGVYGVDPLLILMVLEVVLALSVVVLTNPRTLMRRRDGT